MLAHIIEKYMVGVWLKRGKGNVAAAGVFSERVSGECQD